MAAGLRTPPQPLGGVFVCPVGKEAEQELAPQTLNVALAAGVTDRLWQMDDEVEVIEAFETAQKRADEGRRSTHRATDVTAQ